jgi:hypothetical protein
MVFIPIIPFVSFMAKIPRVEITDKALKVLKVEAALSGLPQKEALEALILRGASSRTLALVEGKTVMEVKPIVEDIPLVEVDVVEEMEEKPKITQKKETEVMETIPEKAVQEAKTALAIILSELREDREPTVNEIAAKMGLTTTGLGRTLAACGIKAKNTHRDMQTVRIYTKPMLAKIEEILETTK